MDTGLASPASLFQLPPPLDVSRIGEYEVVHIGATPIAQYRRSDVTARRHVMVQLAEAGRVAGQEIAQRFGVTPVYVSQLRGRYRAGGSAMLTARRRGPKGPSKVTPQLAARVRTLRATGLSYHAIAEALAATTAVSFQTVRRILLRPPAAQLPLPASARDPAAAAPDDSDTAAAAVRPTEVADGETRYAGAMLLHVALTQMGLWSVFQTLGASVGRTALSVAQVVGLIALGFALRLRSIEGFKTAMRRDFGRLLGVHAAPAVQTLRTRVHALAESVDPAELMRTLVAGWVALEPVWEGAYDLDGHFCPYSGGRPVPKAWHAKRRLVEPGQSDLYVHDASGRVLFFMNRPFNDQLVKGVPQLLTEIHAIAPRDQPIVLVFDRGGYSGPLFRALTREGIGFITYLKGRAARRRFPAHRFRRRWWHVEDPATIQRPRRVVYRIYEKRTRIRGAGLVRTLVVADQDAQVPVLTNCAAMGAAKVVHLLKMRWRQENSFKYLSAHYGVEQLIQHDATWHRDDRLLANPRRAQVRQVRQHHGAADGHRVDRSRPGAGGRAPGSRRPAAAHARAGDARGPPRAAPTAVGPHASDGARRDAHRVGHARHPEHRPPQCGHRDQDRHLQCRATAGAALLPALQRPARLVNGLSRRAPPAGGRAPRRGPRARHAPASRLAPGPPRLGGDAG